MHVIDAHKLKLAGRGPTYATIYLLYDGAKNCVVTWKSGRYAGEKWLRVTTQIKTRGTPGLSAPDLPPYRYAGPLRINAHKKCVKWGGSIAIRGGNGQMTSQSWDSGKYEHCG
ncbi:hypothetical protein [Nonomuraea sp. CA-141351]|uniref:hypothetical protein n=1 Tax=Nonomuraea sp. CA-141351 TaxID=3239996 RepID=UPI003D946B95